MFKLIRFCLINNYKLNNFIRLSSKLSNKASDKSLDSLHFNNKINNSDELTNNEDEEFGVDDKKFEQLNKLNEKSELTKFREDIKQLSLAECLIKYECSIKDALKLDPKLQKRIIIKGVVTDKIFRSNKLKLKIIDTNTFDMIRVYIPYHVYENRLDQIYKGSSIIVTGLVFEATGLDLNSFYCDKLIYVNHTTNKWSRRLFEQTNTIKDIIKLRDYPSEKFRSLKSAAIIKLRSEFINHLHNLMNDEQFIHVTTPILTSFPIQDDQTFFVRNQNRDGYFHTPVYLIKDGDKHLESIVNAIPQIYTITHSFNSNDRRSKQISNELLVLEVCQATDDKLDDLMNQVEYFLKKLTLSFNEKSTSKSQLMIDGHKYDSKLDKDFNYIRMTYNETIDLLKQKDINLQLNEQLTFYHKQIISKYFENYPVFIYDFPFNLETDYDTVNLDGKAQRFELLIGSGLTVCKGKIKSNDNYDELCNKLKELNYDLTQDTIQWYLELRKKGSVPCSWFSLSIDQYLMTFIDLTSLRDIILFPRMPNYCEL